MTTGEQLSTLLWLYCLYVVLLLLPGVLVADNKNSKGRAFMLSFLPDFNSSAQNIIIITADAPTTVFIHVSVTNNQTRYLVAQDSSLHVRLPNAVSVQTNLTNENNAVFVYANQPVSVYAVSSQTSSRAAFMVLPMEKWSHRYIIATYGTYNQKGGEILLLAAENDTNLSVELNFIGPTRCKYSAQIVDTTLKLTFVLQAGQVLRIACNNDLTGSIITGSYPYGVIAGNQCTRVSQGTANAKYCDQIAEMMIPTYTLSQTYIVAAKRQTKLRVIYNYADHENKTDTSPPFQVNYTVSNGGNLNVTQNRLFQEVFLESDTIVRIETNRSVMVVLYTFLFGDAAMTLVPPVDRYNADYNLFFDWRNVLGNETELQHNLDVTAPMEQLNKSVVGLYVTNISALNFTALHASVLKSTEIYKKTLPTASNIIVSISGKLSSMTFMAGMKLDLYPGIDHCDPNPCKNYGACYTISHTWKCFCGDQLAGEVCQQDVLNSCLSQPCQNGGICVDETLDFSCNCSLNFTGKTCDSVITTLATTSVITTTKAVTTTRTTSTTTKTIPTVATTSIATSTKLSTIPRPATTMQTTAKPVKSPERRLCNCTCENITVEIITMTKKEIEKELMVDPKTVHKTKARLESTYDKRPSAAGVGIMGILFLSIVFGSIVLLDLVSAGHYLLTKYFQKWDSGQLQEHHRVRKLENRIMQVREKIKSHQQINRPTKGTESGQKYDRPREIRTMSRTKSMIVLPRFKVEKDGLVVVDRERNSCTFKRSSWSFDRESYSSPWLKDDSCFVSVRNNNMTQLADQHHDDAYIDRTEKSISAVMDDNFLYENTKQAPELPSSEGSFELKMSDINIKDTINGNEKGDYSNFDNQELQLKEQEFDIYDHDQRISPAFVSVELNISTEDDYQTLNNDIQP